MASDDALPEVVSAWVVIAGQLKDIQIPIAAVSSKKVANSKEVINLAAVVLSAMEGAFQLSATANDVMPKNLYSENYFEVGSKTNN